MSRIDDLIRDLCPNGVEYKPLGELLNYEQPGPYLVSSKEYNLSYPTPVLTAGATFILGHTNEQHGIYSASQGSPAIIFDDFTTASKWVDFPFKAKSSAMKILTSSNDNPIDLRYIYYVLDALNYTPSTHSRHWISIFSKMQIAFPPRTVREYIVSALNRFKALEAELEAELEVRRQQYSHFVNSITHSEHTTTLGNIATFDYGLTAKAKDTGTHRFIRITDISPNGYLLPNNAKYVDITPDSNRFIVNDQDILVARTGASDGKTLLVRSENPMSFASYLIRINLDPLQIDPEFYWHFTHSRDYWKQAASLVSEGGQQQFNSNALKRIKTPIPPLTQQREIAKSLNNLHSLAYDITSGLPAEIEARRKQYEYYRDRLLTFSEKK